MQRFFQWLLLPLAVILCHGAAAQQATDTVVAPANALQHYLQTKDSSFRWVITDSFAIGKVKAYDMLLTSQTWRGGEWKHQLTVFVPVDVRYHDALLFISGGSLKNGVVNWKRHDDALALSNAMIAQTNHAVVALLWQVPNQPLYDGRTEDVLISYTLHQFKQSGDYTWPLLFPMVKSAVHAMDAVQAVVAAHHLAVKGFVVTGASKRGWTTWLTGAQDKRVVAIAPMVIDMLNMPVSLAYQVETWHAYSEQINDYVQLEIPQQVRTAAGAAITTMVDPYSYRSQLAMPKLLLLGANDQYWPVDAVKNYIDSIPGSNAISYVPNAGHNLGDGQQAFASLSAFFGFVLAGQPFPRCEYSCSWKAGQAQVRVAADAALLQSVSVWTATAPDRDFRPQRWTETKRGLAHQATVAIQEALPASGYKAFFVQLVYKDRTGGSFTESTRMFVADSTHVLLH